MRSARLALAVALSCGAAYAQPAPDAREAAREHFRLALEHIRQARWRDAIDELERTRATVESPAVMYNLGLAHRAVGQHGAAARAFRRYLELADARDPALRAEAEGYLREAQASLGRVRVLVEPSEAALRLDGTALPDVSADLEVDPGTHVLRASLEGYDDGEVSVTVRPGGREEVRLALRERPARLHVEADVAEAEVSVDGVAQGRGSAEVNLAPGRHVVSVTAEGRVPFRDEVQAARGVTLRVRAVLPSRRRPITASPWFWTAVGVVAAAGVGLTLAFTLGGETALPGPANPLLGRVETP